MNNLAATQDLDRPFSGALGEDYQFIKLMCPNVPILHAQIAERLASYRTDLSELKILEIGCGTGLLTASLFRSRKGLVITAMDSEPTMLDQARQNLTERTQAGQLRLLEQDALSVLVDTADASVDAVVSAYALHNFLDRYRDEALRQIFRVLQPGGWFLNGDRYALDDIPSHTQTVQREVSHFFKTFDALGRRDLLEKWIVHLINDESADHIMRLKAALATMAQVGFAGVEVRYRDGVDALVTAVKPAA